MDIVDDPNMTLMELRDLLIATEASIQETVQLIDPTLVIDHGDAKDEKISCPNKNGKAKVGKSNRGTKRKVHDGIANCADPHEAVCFYCQEKGHWKRSCPKYLEELNTGKFKVASTSEKDSGLDPHHPNKVARTRSQARRSLAAIQESQADSYRYF
ncbi:uncharacterized protein LOC128132924 [Lactuca sativa]|uniref:uncharacterized protein LOC128132924 n=1 Tax=Lactuca sativa TaxID=4236 RepID=UPI000CD807D4|nr:uncharacterized protein LOC128132924 [Lactuca sativa]